MRLLKVVIVFIGAWFIVGLIDKISKSGVSKTFDRMCDVETYLKKRISKYSLDDILCAFDIDLTMLQPEHPAFYVPNVKKYIKIYRSIVKEYPNLDLTLPFLYSFLIPQRLVDEGIYDVLKSLEGTKKIAFTATFSGHYLDFQRLEVLRYEQLKAKKLSFEGNFENEDFVLDECVPYRSNFPCFYKGVLCSNSEQGPTTKGGALCAFLRKVGWVPKFIVLVDDRVKNLSDVSVALKQDFPEVDFVGIEYLGGHKYCPQKISQEEFKLFWEECFKKASQL